MHRQPTRIILKVGVLRNKKALGTLRFGFSNTMASEIEQQTIVGPDLIWQLLFDQLYERLFRGFGIKPSPNLIKFKLFLKQFSNTPSIRHRRFQS